jgi:superfamily I DNA and/or RNA helicase
LNNLKTQEKIKIIFSFLKLEQEAQAILKSIKDDMTHMNNERMLEDDFDLINRNNKNSNMRNGGNNRHFQRTKMDNRHIANFLKLTQLSEMVFYFNDYRDIALDEHDTDANKKHNKDQYMNYLKAKRSEQLDSVLEKEKLIIKDYLIRNFKRSSIKRNNHDENNESNIWAMEYGKRFALYQSWVRGLIDSKIRLADKLGIELNKSAEVLKELRMQQDRAIIENSFIVAMTTTGSSRYHNILKDIGPRIIVVEEAAEVFEAHIVSSLSKHCEHLILIGDHVQLRPNPTVYNLAINYHLDVSLFERLLNNNFTKVMLKCQHRMRPEISVLMNHFYELPIQDHFSVLKFEYIRNISCPVYFITHNKPERRIHDSQSKVNQYELDYMFKLMNYLLKQNYEQTQITILTMYLGQCMEMRKLLRKHNILNVKVSTVDNFQGEENDIILLSLVRSNEHAKIGFLNIHNRVCVALSRARKGIQHFIQIF